MITINPGMTIPEWPHQRPSGKLYLGTTQYDLVDGENTIVLLDTVGAGFADGIESIAGHYIKPGVAGFYDIKAQVTFTNVVADKLYYAWVYASVSGYPFWQAKQAAIPGDLTIAGSAHVYLSATDFLYLYVKSDSGDNTVDVRSLVRYTFLSVQRVR